MSVTSRDGWRQRLRVSQWLLAATLLVVAVSPEPPAIAAGSAGELPPPGADGHTPDPGNPRQKMDTVTVEARKQLQRRVDHFVASVVVHYLHDSLVRWDTAVCPLVAGLTREEGEFILTRISQNARDAAAPLAGEHCNPNFIVVVTAEPDLLLRRWWRRNPGMYNTNNGMGHIRRFMNSRQAVRCWYNTGFRASDGTELSADTMASGLLGGGLIAMQMPVARVPTGTRLQYVSVQALSSVIIVVDQKQLGPLNIGQLGDYVSMIGLAEIHADTDTRDVPTILHLFQSTGEPPQSLTIWDRSLLRALYTTGQDSVLQATSMKISMAKAIAAAP